MSSVVYEVKLARSAKKEVKLLDGVIRVRVVHAFRSLTNDPRPPGCRKLVGATNRWRTASVIIESFIRSTIALILWKSSQLDIAAKPTGEFS